MGVKRDMGREASWREAVGTMSSGELVAAYHKAVAAAEEAVRAYLAGSGSHEAHLETTLYLRIVRSEIRLRLEVSQAMRLDNE